jgi:hypothetical protein
MAQQRFSSSHTSCAMLFGFSFDAIVRGFSGDLAAFTKALFFGGMTVARVFRGMNWMGAGMERWAGEMSGRRGRGIPYKFVGVGFMWLIHGSHALNPSWREVPAHPIRALCEGADTGLPALLLGSIPRRRALYMKGSLHGKQKNSYRKDEQIQDLIYRKAKIESTRSEQRDGDETNPQRFQSLRD